jgi:hypothetical protein
LNRRAFFHYLGRWGWFALGARVWAEGSAGYNLPSLSGLPATRPIPPEAISLVARVINPMILAGSRIHELALRTVLEHGVCLATDREEPTQAWRALVSPDDVIGVKFDPVGADKLETTAPLARQLIHSLESAGFDRQQVVLIDGPRDLTDELKTRPRKFGWRTKTAALGQERTVKLATVLDQITALINVPFLKTDRLCGIAGCIKNASLPFVQPQAPWYADACAPHLADILALPEMRKKLRLHIVNALRGVFDRGPAVQRECIWRYAGLLVSRDPVAADTVALDVLNTRRAEANLPILGDNRGRLPHVHAAATRGLGTDDMDYIRIVKPPDT